MKVKGCGRKKKVLGAAERPKAKVEARARARARAKAKKRKHRKRKQRREKKYVECRAKRKDDAD